MFEKEIDGGHDNNNNDDKDIDDNSLLEEFNKNDDVQFILFEL